MDSSIASEKRVKRHRLATRIWHWINAIAVIILIMSGLMISNAHPHLYWGHYGANFDTALVNLPQFPGWMTIPSSYSLAGGRHWHLFFSSIFAWGYVFWLFNSVINGHIWDFILRKHDMSPRHLGREILNHARLRFPTGMAALSYNSLQKLSYILVLFVLIPLIIVTGLCLMPGMAPVIDWAIDMFGGRQSARTLHFGSMAMLTLFIGIHLMAVLAAGPINHIRSMLTGWYDIRLDRSSKRAVKP